MNDLLRKAIAALPPSDAREVLPDLETKGGWAYSDVVELFRQTVNEALPSNRRTDYPRQAEHHQRVLAIRRYARERVRTMRVQPDMMIQVVCMMAGKHWRVGKEAAVFLDRVDQVLGQNFDLWCECQTLLLKGATDLRDINLVVQHVARQVVNKARTAKDLDRAKKLVAKTKKVQVLLLEKAITYAAELERRLSTTHE